MNAPIQLVPDDEETKSDILPLEALTYFSMEAPGGFEGPKVFIGNVNDICKHVEGNDINFYYVIALQELTDEKTKAKSVTPQIFKVTKSSSFRSVVPTTKAFKLDKVEPSITFTLPRMPWKLISTVDQFFRKVENELGTESTVILTYDSAYNGLENESNGWGILIPDQQNTATNCHYTPESVATLLENDTTSIVGTIHSHPGMSAYASGTDHKDQSEEDGLHITFGWQKHKGNITEYHIELAIDGKNYGLSPEQIFQPAPSLEPQEIIDTWMEKVSKKTSGYSSSSTGPKAPIGGTTITTGGGSNNGNLSGGYYDRSSAKEDKLETSFYPKEGPSLDVNIVIGQISSGITHPKCPFCLIVLTEAELMVANKCVACQSHVVYGDYQDLDGLLKDLHSKSAIKDIKGGELKTVYLWEPADDFLKTDNYWTPIWSPPIPEIPSTKKD